MKASSHGRRPIQARLMQNRSSRPALPYREHITILEEQSKKEREHVTILEEHSKKERERITILEAQSKQESE